MAKLRIFIADDHGIMRAGLKALINAQPDMEVISEAADGRTAADRIRACLPDVAIIDLSMPVLNGAQVAEIVKRSCPRVRILALTVHEDTAYVRMLLEAGVEGYLLKRAAVEDLLTAIRTVASEGTYLDPIVSGKVVRGYLGRQHGYRDHRPDLSEREFEVIRLVAEGYSNKDIAARLSLSVKTVESHKKNAMAKLGFSNRAEVVRYAVQQEWLRN